MTAPNECPRCKSIDAMDVRWSCWDAQDACHPWHTTPSSVPDSPGGEPARCAFCQQKLEWQGRYEGWDCCCQGYWFAINTGSACPKSNIGHQPENADLRRQLQEAIGVTPRNIGNANERVKTAERELLEARERIRELEKQ